jgi:hypothetical protein
LLNVQETSAELAKQTSEFQASLKGEKQDGTATPPKPTPPEHKQTSTAETQNRTASQPPTIPPDAERKPES